MIASDGQETAADALPEDDEEQPVDLTSRELCPDGACIGVIGPDGKCKVCGTAAPATSAGPIASLSSADHNGAGRSSASDAGDDGGEGDDQDDGGEPPPDLAARRLCSDGACIGVIGEDDRCRVCGKPYTGEPQD